MVAPVVHFATARRAGGAAGFVIERMEEGGVVVVSDQGYADERGSGEDGGWHGDLVREGESRRAGVVMVRPL